MEQPPATILVKIPNWYQELSNNQEEMLKSLHTFMRNDALELYCPQTSKFIDAMGIHPPLSVLQISSCLEKSDYRPIQFLKYAAELLGLRVGDRLPGKEYSANERVVYSSISQLLYPDLIRKLDVLLPIYNKDMHEKLENFKYMDTSPKKDTTSPYLSVPELLLKKKQIALQHNKQVKEKRKPYLYLLTKVNYKQDIISEIISNEIVCDEKLKYLYHRGTQEFEILKKKFYTLEDKRKDLEMKLHPDKMFIPKNLKYETFELLKKSKIKKKKIILPKNVSDSHNSSSTISDFSSKSNESVMSVESNLSLSAYPFTIKNRKYNNDMNVFNMSTRNLGDTKNETQNRPIENVVENNNIELPKELLLQSTSSPNQHDESSETDTVVSTLKYSIECVEDCASSLEEDMSTLSNSSKDVIKVDKSISLCDMTEYEFQRELSYMKPKYQLEAALKYLTHKNKNFALLPFLKDLPKVKIWYERRITPSGVLGQTQFKKPDEIHFENGLKSIKQTKFILPQIKQATVDKKALCEEIQNIKAAFTRELKLKQIDLSRDLFTFYNVECLQHESDVRKFKRMFFAIFPTREKDILIK